LEIRNEIVSGIRTAFAERISSKLPIAHCVIDFAVELSTKGQNRSTIDKIWVIELNPFFQQTGACLFHWACDSEILHHGPFQSRFIELDKSPQMNVNFLERYLPPVWLQVVATVHPNYYETKKETLPTNEQSYWLSPWRWCVLM